MRDADIVLLNKVELSRELLRGAAKLKLVAVAGTDPDSAHRLGGLGSTAALPGRDGRQYLGVLGRRAAVTGRLSALGPSGGPELPGPPRPEQR
jgi:hypothetical protein